MSPDPNPPHFLLPSEQRLRALEATQMFTRRTVWGVYAVALFIGGALYLRSQLHRTALLAPIDPNFHAAMIGAGVFIGVLLAAVEYDGWRLGIGKVHGQIPSGIGALLCMGAVVGLSGLGGHYVAGQLVEWQAFHDLTPQSTDTVFTVVGGNSGRTNVWVDLSMPNGYRFSISCGSDIYRALPIGDEIILPVETGRNGIQRVTLPSLGNLRHH